MLSCTDFVRQSLGLHLFFARIMKEHSFFLEIGFTPRDANYTQRADAFRMEFEKLLREAVILSNGVVDPRILQSGEVITPYTLNAELLTEFYIGIDLPTDITRAEAGLCGGVCPVVSPILEKKVCELNERAICLIQALIKFKAEILSNVLSCKMFTFNYPLLIEHIMREAKLYLLMVQRLQNRVVIDIEREAFEQEAFWNRIMAEHAKFIRGLLDPTEEDLINVADAFGHQFDELTCKAKRAIDLTLPACNVTCKSLKATAAIRDFKAQATQGLLACRIRSIIVPLLGDHVLREANHYLRLLKMFAA